MATDSMRDAAYSGTGHTNSHGAHPTVGTYFRTYIALMVLLGVTVGAYLVDLSHLPVLGAIPGINLIFALIIAIMKASLVILFFMNVKGSSRLTWLWATIGFIWLLIMGGILLDYASRSWVKVQGWQ